MSFALRNLSPSTSLSKRRRRVIRASETENNKVADESKKASSVNQLLGIRGAAQETVFNTHDKLVLRCKDVGKINGIVVVIAKSHLVSSGRPPRILLGCTRRGKGINKKIDKIFQRCGRRFALKGLKLPKGDEWKLQVVCGLHNHPLATKIEGHLRPTTEEEDPTALDCAMSIEDDQAQNRIEVNMHTPPSKSFKVMRTRSTASTRLIKAFPEAIQLLIKDAKDVFADGNRGFRIVAELLGRNDQDGWKKIRAELTSELQIHQSEYFDLWSF